MPDRETNRIVKVCGGTTYAFLTSCHTIALSIVANRQSTVLFKVSILIIVMTGSKYTNDAGDTAYKMHNHPNNTMTKGSIKTQY